uniref:Uncharacterized protein n=1 Tax=Globodera rostochiensis TaxID=31243 RepID=A0A914HFU2_GLORO
MPSKKLSSCAGDVVGCGVNLATLLNTTNLFVADSVGALFPFVMLTLHGDKIEANFGPNFKFNRRSDLSILWHFLMIS